MPEVLLDNLVATVDEYFYNGCWHFEEGFFMRYTDIVIDIVNLKLVDGPDYRIWPNSCSGELSSRVAYGFLHSSLPSVSWSTWIWGNFIPQCRSTLVWRAIWGKLPMAGALLRIGFHGPSRCALCFEDLDDFDHIFSSCKFTQAIYSEVLRVFDVSICLDSDFLDIFLQATRVNFGKRVLCICRLTFVSMIWLIWFLRNESIFSNKRPTFAGALARLLAMIRESADLLPGDSDNSARDNGILARLKISGRPCSPSRSVQFRWIPPDPGWLKVNIDGSISPSPGQIYVGGIFRNSRRFFAAAFVEPAGWGLPLDAEIAAGLIAIQHAHRLGWRHIWIESDSKLAVAALQRDESHFSWRLQGLGDLVRRLRQDMTIRVTHIYREGNRAADLVAKRRTREFFLGGCPDFITRQLFLDMNTIFSRVIH
ncbi:hypothetical protein ACS0TY_006523 [Phlomoides rotata]